MLFLYFTLENKGLQAVYWWQKNSKWFWNTGQRGSYILNYFPVVKVVLIGHKSTTALEGGDTETPPLCHPILFLIPLPNALPTRYPHGEMLHNYEEFSLYATKEGNVYWCPSQVTLCDSHNTPNRKQWNQTLKSPRRIHKDRCYLFLSKAIYAWGTSDQLRLVPPRAALMERGAADAPSTLCPAPLSPHPPNTRQRSRPCRKIIHHKYVTKSSL